MVASLLLLVTIAAPADARSRLRVSAPAAAVAGELVAVAVAGGPARVTLVRGTRSLLLRRGVRGTRRVRVPAGTRAGRWTLRACRARSCARRPLRVSAAPRRAPTRPTGSRKVPTPATTGVGPPAADDLTTAPSASTTKPGALVVDADDPACADSSAVWCSLDAAVAAAPPGGTVTLRSATYPALTSTRDDLTLAGAGRPVLARLALRGADRWTVSGITTTGGIDLRDVRDVRLRDLDVRTIGVLALRADRLTIADSTFHDLDFAASQPWNHGTAAGYGVRMNGGSDLVVRDTRFERLTLDAVQLTGVTRATITGSTVIGLRTSRGSHADALQVQAGSSDVVWSRSTVRDSDRGVFIEGTAGAVTIADALFLHLREWAVDSYADDTTVVRTSMWDTGQAFTGNQSAIILQPTAVRAVIVDSAMRKLVFTAGQVAAEHHNFVAQPKSYVTYSPTDVLGGTTDATLRDPLVDPTTLLALPGSPLRGAASDGGTIGLG